MQSQLIKVSVRRATGAITEKAEMNEHGVLFYPCGKISTVSAEKASNNSVYAEVEEIKPEPIIEVAPSDEVALEKEAPSLTQSVPIKKKKKKS